MPIKDYYVILGVSRTESPAGIRTAYHGLAKKLHPDRAGEQGAAEFREATEAYHVLSDADHRRRYDQDLRLADEEANLPPSFLRRPTRQAYIPPRPIFHSPESIRPSFEVMHERLMRNFTGTGVPKAERLQGLNIEVRLSPEEALRVESCLWVCLSFEPAPPMGRGGIRSFLPLLPRRRHCGGASDSSRAHSSVDKTRNGD